MQKRLRFVLPSGAPQRWLACVIALALSLLPPSLSQAAPAEVKLEITPAVAQLAPGEAVEALIIVRNGSPGRLEDLQLRWFTNVGVLIQSDSLADVRIESEATLAQTVLITQTASAQTAGTVYFQLNYSYVPADGGPSVPGTAVGTLEIQERARETVGQMAQARIETTLDQIEEPHEGLIFLVVQNLASVPITVTHITAYHPNFINLQLPDAGAGIELAPQDSRTFPIAVTVSDTVQTGQQRLILDVGIAWARAGRAGSGSLLVPHTVEVGILGESDLLRLVGLPSFLFLPGFLMLSTFVLLWTRVAPRSPAQSGLSLPESALISITLSLLATIAYPVLTPVLLGARRNYLEGYGIQDVFWVWMGSLVVSFAAWAVAAGGLALREKYRLYRAKRAQEQREREQAELKGILLAEIVRRTPTLVDKPLQILEKMAINNVGFPLTQARVKFKGATSQCFIILPAAEDRPFVWVAPPISLKLQAASSDSGGSSMDKLNQAAKDSPAALSKALGEATSTWEAIWGKAGLVTGPVQVNLREVERLDQLPARLFIE